MHGKMEQVGKFILLKDSVISGKTAIALGGEKGFVLDGTILDNVTFQDATVIYKGAGPLKMHNVRFINCQFVVPLSSQGNQLLTALAEPVVSVQIGEIPPDLIQRIRLP